MLCLLFVVRCLFFGKLLLFVACYWLCAVCCLLLFVGCFVVRCFVFLCWLFVVRCLAFGVCWLLLVVSSL